jgi:hypothetical protein
LLKLTTKNARGRKGKEKEKRKEKKEKEKGRGRGRPGSRVGIALFLSIPPLEVSLLKGRESSIL